MREPASRKGAGYLLDDLAQAAGCDYLSDLRCSPFYRYPLYLALADFPAEEYSAKKWNEAASYVLGQPARFPEGGEAYGFLQRTLAEYTGAAAVQKG
ncbi:hypothetical protein [Anaerotruncus rubiinfantis]|jgi:hypothetical protein|uniref:hypothetical protein n=1 Tax=Anaerotruncus rubiinfantis TaxID=1720200 RepID=UPI0018988E21|nr:hypothetical protein [Anaerotruncus rubiinfantis]